MKNFYRDGGVALSVAILVIVSLILSGMLYSRDSQTFMIIAPFIVLSVGFTIGKFVRALGKNSHYLNIIKNEISLADSQSLYRSPIAVGIIDPNRRFVWFNAAFIREFGAIAEFGTPLDGITSASMELMLSNSGAQVKYSGKVYKVNANAPLGETAGEIYVLYFDDITKQVVLETEKKLSKPVVMIIVIDSYEEISNANDSDSAAASVMVLIERMLEDYIKTTNGILKKVGRDRFLAVVEERHAQTLIENKVKLLDKAREISVTERMNVTLSIGIGKTGKDMSESEVFARQALEMALGRGGDQAAVKNKSGFEFYGGFSKGIERHTKVRARIIANSLLDLADNSDIIYIMGHKFSDLDSIGSAVGLACGLRNLGKSAYIVIDRSTSLGVGLIERVEQSETSGIELFISPEKAHETFTDNSLLIIVDTHSKKLLEDAALYENSEKTVVIDHHRKTVDFIENALIFHHEVTASSTSEMVTELLQYFGPAGVIKDTKAEALLAGIMLDTKNFSLETGVRTFEAAAFLRKHGADTINIKPLFADTIDDYRKKSALVGDAIIYKKCAIACYEGEDNNANIRIIAPQAADELLEISGVDASFLIYETSDKEISLSARSLGKINVQIVMEFLGGGGHHTMAGAQLSDIGIEQARRRLIEAIDKYYEERNLKEGSKK